MASLVLYDGDCRSCHAIVRWILPRDPAGRFRFASQDSEVGRRLLEEHGLLGERGKTLVLVEDGRPHLRSEAVFRIAGQLPGAARLLSLARVLPRPVVDRAYDAYARRRYRLFGKADRCLVVGPEYRDRFLDGSGAPAG